ncbi:MAG: radical SAM protein [Candidatus Margulisiibacteriota bacterium]
MTVTIERNLPAGYTKWLAGFKARLTRSDLKPSELGAAPYAVEVRVLQNICNLKCFSCIGQNEGGERIIADPNMVRSFITEAGFSGVSQIDFTSPNSEPSLHPEFESFIETTADSGMMLAVFTNATALSFPTISLMAKYANYVLVNLGAPNSRIYREMYGKNTFNRALANLQKLVDESKKYPGKAESHVAVNYTLNYYNSSEETIIKMIRLFSSIGVNSLRIVWTFPLLFGAPAPERLRKFQPQLEQAEIENIIRNARGKGIDLFFTGPTEPKMGKPDSYCWAQFQRLVLDTSGHLLACRSTYGFNGLTIGSYHPGNFGSLLVEPARDTKVTCAKCQPSDQYFNEQVEMIL